MNNHGTKNKSIELKFSNQVFAKQKTSSYIPKMDEENDINRII